jgi:eukaryotic-like serine/threonine-protein kinase
MKSANYLRRWRKILAEVRYQAGKKFQYWVVPTTPRTNMSRAACPQCGSSLPVQSPLGLCPVCLLKHGLESRSEVEKPTSADAPTGRFDPRLAGTIDRGFGSTSSNLRPERRLPEPGELFGGYQIVRMLGKGGMGAVYEAEETDTGRRVALKLLKQSFDSPEARKRFLHEGRLAASVNHPNSVYVFGTEEIDGAPAITMELVGGGTLQQLVHEKGPLPIGKAVDTILQIIAGLDAAQKVGVLHRDIKPANCFIDSDGTVKIGDFGLSISTGPRGDVHVTQGGVFQGTPAFAAPEQLRGDELDVRSDIYSVGVTFYYMLTGRVPFEADSMVKLLDTVMEQPVTSPRKWRTEIPRPLEAIVLRCLAKQPRDRFRDYQELRHTLLPFTSAAPSPATLGFRLLAFLVDVLILALLSMLLSRALAFGTDQFPALRFYVNWSTGLIFFWISLQICYFGVPEGVWGASPGKALFRLKVVGPNRAPPGIPRALVRAAIPLLLWHIDDVATAFFDPVFLRHTVRFGLNILSFILPLWLFSKSQKSNAYAARHDLVTGTRVVLRESLQSRAALSASDESSPITGVAPQIGPYQILQPLATNRGEEWHLGYDTRLLRRVWVHKLPAGAASVKPRLRGVSRVGRLRWLSGRRTQTDNWDAYEALSGQALTTTMNCGHSWSVVRFWLLDLAEELVAAAKDETSPARLAVDRVWITRDGRAKLLDVPPPGTAELADDYGQVQPPEGNARSMRTFLNQVAIAGLEGRPVSVSEANSRLPKAPVPVQASEFLLSLKNVASIGVCTQTLRNVVRQSSEVSRIRRLALVLIIGAPCFMALAMSLVMLFSVAQYQVQHPDLQPLFMHLLALENLRNPGTNELKKMPREGTPDEISAFEKYIEIRFGPAIQRERKSTMESTYDTIELGDVLWLGQQVVQANPNLNAEELIQAEQIIAPLQQHFSKHPGLGPIIRTRFIQFFGEFSMSWLILISGFSLIAALVNRGGLLFWALGLTVVRSDGAPASRFRVLARSLIAWSPFLVVFTVWVSLLWPSIQSLDGSDLFEFLQSPRGVLLMIAGGTQAAFYLAITIGSALLPGRGIADRLAGTWLVPR